MDQLPHILLIRKHEFTLMVRDQSDVTLPPATIGSTTDTVGKLLQTEVRGTCPVYVRVGPSWPAFLPRLPKPDLPYSA